MLTLVRKPLVRTFGDAPLPRLWLLFFGEAVGAPWWARLFHPGFRHVTAAAWYPEMKCWVYFNPSRWGIVIELYPEGKFPLLPMVRSSASTLRFVSVFERGNMPASFFCVAAIKSLLGVRSCALSPRQLQRHLLARGAKIIEAPSEDHLGQHPQTATNATPGERGSGGESAA